MIFPTDQEIFKDLGPDGKLDPERFPKGKKTARQVFHSYIRENENEKLTVRYTYYKSHGDAGAGADDVKKTVDSYETSLFHRAADEAFQSACRDGIGEFPEGTVNAGNYTLEKRGISEAADVVVKEQLEKITPVEIGSISKMYADALEAKKNMALSKVAVIFLLLHMAIVAYSALPLLPGMDSHNWFGQGFDWAIIVGGCLMLIIAWLFHMGTMNIWGVPAFIHLLFTGIFLGWQVGDHAAPKSRLITAAIILAIGVITLVRYLIDSFGGMEKYRIRQFTDWCDNEALEHYRKLRFFILWYKDINRVSRTPYDSIETEIREYCANRKRFK